MVVIDAIGELVTENLLCASVLELPDLEGVENEFELARRAVGDSELAVLLVLVTGAVREQTNEVEVLELLGRGGALQGREKIVVDIDILGECRGGVFWIGIEITCICLLWLLERERAI